MFPSVKTSGRTAKDTSCVGGFLPVIVKTAPGMSLLSQHRTRVQYPYTTRVTINRHTMNVPVTIP